MNLEDLTERLRRTGLGRYEAAVYLGLLLDPDARVAEIARTAEVPQPKVYQALDKLVEKGFCVLAPDAVNRYRAVKPALAFSHYIEQLQSSERAAAELSRELTVLQSENVGQKLWAPPFEVQKGQKQISAQLVEQIKASRTEIRFMSTGPLLMAEFLRDAILRALERGVRISMVCDLTCLEQSDVREELERQRAMGVDLRVSASVPGKMVLIDRGVALVALSNATGEEFMVLLMRHAGLVDHCLASFDLHWQTGQPLSVQQGDRSIEA